MPLSPVKSAVGPIRQSQDMSGYQLSNLGKQLEYILGMKDKISIISNMAFRAIDDDGSGQIDSQELSVVLRNVAAKMGIP